ncbi:Myelin regulatory factor-like protein 2 [Frankliniella fusca]|uniref:Myelin regulatory factor-like protein 2 n=1 Tax=Frankliniella fusca TaxID=407009 RepID=A0AAE1H8X8_9NEOP|nr:Myelin regulatory factor-like protein 2 [Frankliniella fusca]
MQAVYSYPKFKLGLYHLILSEPEEASIIRSAGALPLLSTNEIMNGLHDLGVEAVQKGWMPQLRLFFKYMDKEWIPKIPVLSVKNSKHRTNNISETTNRPFNKFVKVSNLSCFNVLKAFVRLNERYTLDLESLKNPGLSVSRVVKSQRFAMTSISSD